MRNKYVHQWMSYPVITISPKATILQASNMMRQYDIHHLAVILEDGALCGVLSSNDIRGIAPDQIHTLETAVLVEHVMSATPVIIDPKATLAEASVKLMIHHVGCLPVVDSGELVGILTESDLFAVLVKQEQPVPTAPYSRYQYTEISSSKK